MFSLYYITLRDEVQRMLIGDCGLRALASEVAPRHVETVAAVLRGLNRQPGGQELERACETLAHQLREAGADRTEYHAFPYGPGHHYLSWAGERQPYTDQAELWLEDERGQWILVCRASEDPNCSMGALRSTSPTGEVYELVAAGGGTQPSDYRRQRVVGKAALITGYHFAAAMLECLANRQAVGLLSGPGRAMTDIHRPLPRRLGPPSLFAGNRPFGFNLTAAWHDRLACRLSQGQRVRIRVQTKIGIDTGTLPVLSAAIEGSDLSHESIVLVADLSSTESTWASAATIEVVRLVHHCVVAGIVPPPRRTLQVLLVPGARGVVAWLAEQEASRVRAAVQLAGVADTTQCPKIVLEHPPANHPSFIPSLIHEHLVYSTEPTRTDPDGSALVVLAAPYSAESPISPFVGWNSPIPSVCVRSLFTPSASGRLAGSTRQLLRGLASALIDLASLDGDQMPRLLCQHHLLASKRLIARGEALRRRHGGRRQSDATPADLRHQLWFREAALLHGLAQERRLLRSCVQFFAGPGQQALDLVEIEQDLELMTTGIGRSLCNELRALSGPEKRIASLRRQTLSAIERRASEVRIVRCFDGPLPQPELLRETPVDQRNWLAHHAAELEAQPLGEELLQWVDGERSLLEIYDLLSFDHPAVDLRLIDRYLEVLEATGLVRRVQQPTLSRTGEG
jgi:hypothetical protein